MGINLDDLQKLEASSVQPKLEDTTAQVQAIVKVKRAGYVPKGVRLRARIDPHIITCDIPAKGLSKLEKDPQVESYSVKKELHTAE